LDGKNISMINHHLLTILFAAASLSPAAAQTVLIDWSTAASVTNPAGDGKHWNSLGAPTASNISYDLATTALIDSTGASSGISVAMFSSATGSSGAGFGGTGIAGPSGPDPFDEANAVIDGIYSNQTSTSGTSSGKATITFTGLVPSTTYNISAIGGRASNGEDGKITVTTGTTGSPFYTLSNSGTVLNFSVTSNASGVIVFDFIRTTTTISLNATFNAMSITPAPAPTPLVVTSVGKSSNTTTVNFKGTNGVTYVLNKSLDLDFSVPNVVDTVTLSGTDTGTLEDTSATEDKAFYRVQSQ
jgi:hypothetical protein